MTIEEVRKYCNHIAGAYGYIIDVPIESNLRIKQTLGRVKFRCINKNCFPLKIEFSQDLLQEQEEVVIDIIKHELAHYFVLKDTKKNHNHDAVWKTWARRLGCPPRARLKREGAYRNKEEYKYIVLCADCKKIIAGYKRISKVIRYSKNYRSLCCGAKIKVEAVKK